MKVLSSAEYLELQKREPKHVLLDVRLDDDFEEAHLDGAVNNCVYEVAFGERLNEHAPDKSVPVVLYGESDASYESRTAAEKLERAGYKTVYDLRCGIHGCEADGLNVVRGQAKPAAASIPDGSVPVDIQESRVEWLGRNLINKHTGTLALKSGELVFKGGQLAGGRFVFDMNQLNCDDLKGTPLHQVLIDHLKSDDFFDVERFPEAVLQIDEAVPTADARPGAPNLEVQGRLTLRGVTVPITFHASAGLTDKGKPAAQAAFAIDRTKWGVLYGSGGFFHRLAGHLVNDLIEVQVRVVAQ